MRRFDLRSLHFDESDEAWRQLPVDVSPFAFGGLDYTVAGDTIDLELNVARVGDNLTLVGEFETQLLGPCQRCLGDAAVAIAARGVEYVHHGYSELDDEDDESGYVEANVVDLERWVRDLVAEALPEKLLCDEGCRGLCPRCGANFNSDPEHHHDDR
ncbi:MAG: YceD family protein [Thermoleophilia bacterium]